MSSNQPISGSSASKDTTPKQEEVKKSPLKKVGNAEGNDGPSFAPTPTTKPGASSRLSGLFRSKPKPQLEEGAPKLMYGIEEHEKDLFPEEFEETKHMKAKSKSKNTSDDTTSLRSNKSRLSMSSVKSAVSRVGQAVKDSEVAEFAKDIGTDFKDMGSAILGLDKIPGYNPNFKVSTSPLKDRVKKVLAYESPAANDFYKPKPTSFKTPYERIEETSAFELKEKQLKEDTEKTEDSIKALTKEIQDMLSEMNDLQDCIAKAKSFQESNGMMLKMMQLNQTVTDLKLERSEYRTKLMLLNNDRVELKKEKIKMEHSYKYMDEKLNPKR